MEKFPKPGNKRESCLLPDFHNPSADTHGNACALRGSIDFGFRHAGIQCNQNQIPVFVDMNLPDYRGFIVPNIKSGDFSVFNGCSPSEDKGVAVFNFGIHRVTDGLDGKVIVRRVIRFVNFFRGVGLADSVSCRDAVPV